MAENSIAPSRRAVDLYLDGADWKLALHVADGTTQIGTALVGSVQVTSSIVALPLDLRGLGGGEPANELRFHTAGTVKLQLSRPLSDAFPVSAHAVVDGEVIGAEVERIVDLGTVTRARIAWG